jgi:L-ascorbate metabolism protein UlaG (beta-lactamase superfamily)
VDTEKEFRPNPPARDLRRRDFLGLTAAIPFASEGVNSSLHARQAAEPATPVLRAQRLAWAGVRLELPSAVICVDPLISTQVWGVALKDPLIPFTAGPDTRSVLVTHLHPDHFDPPAITQIVGTTGTVICDARVAPSVASRGFRIRGLGLFEPAMVGDFTVTAVPAVDGYGDPQVSWVVDGGGRRVIHGGDTLWHGWWWQVGRQLGPFDAAFLPINGARFAWRRPFAEVPSVMTAEQAVAAAVVLGAKRVVPIHYGVIGASGYQEDPKAEATLVEICTARRMPAQILQAGQWVQWDD